MLLHLVRHAHYAQFDQALGGREPHALSPAGQAQAAALAGRFARRPVASVTSSPVRRALETAALIAARLGLPAEPDNAFNEIDYAGWTGRRFADLDGDPAWRAWNAFRSTAGVPGGETMLQVQARAIGGVTRIAAQAGPEAVIVTHADVIKAILAHFLGAPLDLIHRLEIAPASISQAILTPQDARVIAVNCLAWDALD
ncbi:MAG TPA: histidine phosphatase family protein [Rhodopila sp.]|nr:histidine phosphatase family protein [Rhodopila sp.]